MAMLWPPALLNVARLEVVARRATIGLLARASLVVDRQGWERSEWERRIASGARDDEHRGESVDRVWVERLQDTISKSSLSWLV
jgi:hypothetical protein